MAVRDMLCYYLLEEGLGDLGRASNDELALGPLRHERVEQGAECVVPERHIDQDLQTSRTSETNRRYGANHFEKEFVLIYSRFL
jgi:hypothetical protein